MLLPGQIYIALGPWHFGGFRNIFLPNVGELKTIKSLTWYRAILWEIRPWLMHYVHKKARCDPEIATFRTKTIYFFQVFTFKLAGKH